MPCYTMAFRVAPNTIRRVMLQEQSHFVAFPDPRFFIYIYEKLAGALHAKTRFIRPQVTITIHTSEIKHLQKYGTKQVFHFCRNTAKESVPKNLPSYLNHALQPQSLDKITWKTCEWVAVRGSGPQSHYLQCAPFANLNATQIRTNIS